MKRKDSIAKIGKARVDLHSEIHFHEVLDTKVIIGGELLCTIEGSRIREFLEAMNKVIDEFRI